MLAEGPFIAQYLTEHFGGDKKLMPTRWKEGQEGKILGETPQWLRFVAIQGSGNPFTHRLSDRNRFQYLMYFTEGSFFPYLLLYLIFNGESPVYPLVL